MIRTPYLLRSSGESAADMILRRSLEGALKCALRHLRRDEVTRSEYFMAAFPTLPSQLSGVLAREPCGRPARPVHIRNHRVHAAPPLRVRAAEFVAALDIWVWAGYSAHPRLHPHPRGVLHTPSSTSRPGCDQAYKPHPTPSTAALSVHSALSPVPVLALTSRHSQVRPGACTAPRPHARVQRSGSADHLPSWPPSGLPPALRQTSARGVVRPWAGVGPGRGGAAEAHRAKRA